MNRKIEFKGRRFKQASQFRDGLSRRLAITFEDYQIEALNEAAQRDNISVSAFVRNLIDEAMVMAGTDVKAS